MEKIKWIRVMCFKHDGSLHRIWDKAALIYEDEEKIIAFVDGEETFSEAN